MQIESPTNPGTYIAMTCNVEYKRDNSKASTVVIKNYFGNESIRVEDQNLNSKWDSYGTPSPGDMQYFERGYSASDRLTYRTVYSKKISW